MKYVFVFSLVMMASFVQAQVGKNFPGMETTNVENDKVSLPEDTQGKYTLLGLAFSKRSEDDLNTWFTPIFQKFIQKSTGVFSGFAYDVNVYFVPMFTGVKTAAEASAKKQAMKNVDPQLLPYILFYKGEMKKYKEELDFGKKDTPYFFVLDKKGKIVYTTSGPFSDDKMDEIEESIED